VFLKSFQIDKRWCFDDYSYLCKGLLGMKDLKKLLTLLVLTMSFSVVALSGFGDDCIMATHQENILKKEIKKKNKN